MSVKCKATASIPLDSINVKTEAGKRAVQIHCVDQRMSEVLSSNQPDLQFPPVSNVNTNNFLKVFWWQLHIGRTEIGVVSIFSSSSQKKEVIPPKS